MLHWPIASETAKPRPPAREFAPLRFNGQVASGDFFSTLGVKAAVGRVFEPSDDSPSAEPVSVLNFGYWQSAFGGSRDVIRRTLDLNNVAFTIIGVAEQRFTGITPRSAYDVWLPLSDAQRITNAVRWENCQGTLVPGGSRPHLPPLQRQGKATVELIFCNQPLYFRHQTGSW